MRKYTLGGSFDFGNDAPHAIADGNYYSDASACLPVLNPATDKPIGTMSTLDDMPANSLSSMLSDVAGWARTAQECWHWKVQEQEKEAVFQAIIKKFTEHMGPLARTMTLESGKLWKWALAEVQEAIDTLWHYHGEISRCHTHDGFTRCQLADKNAFSVRMPYGVILKISPWNFPLAVPMWAIAGALAGGNAVLLKPAEQTPFTMFYASLLIKDAIGEVITDAPRQSALRGLLQIMQGPGETTGKTLLEKFPYDKATFTGSGNVGKIVASVAGGRLKPCHLELGGHAAMVVLDDFDIDLAVQEAITANLGDSGQRCVSTRVVFVQESCYKEFVAKYVERARARRVGHPMDAKTEMGPLISEEQLKRVDNMVRETVKESSRLPILGGYRLNSGYPGDRKGLNVDTDAIRRGGYYYAPTVFTEVPYGVTAMDEEIFGPVIVINPLAGKTREEAFWNAVELVNKSDYGLSNALLTNDRRFSSRAPGRFKTGLLYIGRGTTGAELNKYFGGVKSSGWGREGKGLDDWTQIQQVYDDYHGKARMAQSGAEDKMKEMFAAKPSPLEKE